MKRISAVEITSFIKQQLKGLEDDLDFSETGIVTEASDGIVRIVGMDNCMYNELLEFEHGVFGVALNLEEDNIGAVILGDYLEITEGQHVRRTGRILSIPVSNELMGRVVDALGNPVDGGQPIEPDQYLPIERLAPSVLDREPVEEPLQTGIKAIDSMIPIGRGQRELIIGDRQTGKTAIAIDAIINQKHNDIICVYVAIGQKQSTVSRLVNTLKTQGALDYTIIVQASASEAAPLLYIAPYSGCTIGEYFMHKGKSVLVVYDDLSKHAVAYRQLSLLLRRPPGREAYPGDVFYLHSRLLERAAKLAEEFIIVRKSDPETIQKGLDGKTYKMRDEAEIKIAETAMNAIDDDCELRKLSSSGGSLTALPIIETQAGDVSAYIPTNVISITDGQIFLETDLFHSGVKPAINPGISVSRVGGAAQIKAYKKISGNLRINLAQYRELKAFSQFGSDLDPATQRQLNRGERLVEILKQEQYYPMPVSEQVIIVFAATRGFLDNVPVSHVKEFEKQLLDYMRIHHPITAREISDKQKLDDTAWKILEKQISEFAETFNNRETEE